MASKSEEEIYPVIKTPRRIGPNVTPKARSSERIKVRQERTFVLPKKADSLEIITTPSKSPRLQPRRLINDHTKENSRYNTESYSLCDSEESDPDDFINDRDADCDSEQDEVSNTTTDSPAGEGSRDPGESDGESRGSPRETHFRLRPNHRRSVLESDSSSGDETGGHAPNRVIDSSSDTEGYEYTGVESAKVVPSGDCSSNLRVAEVADLGKAGNRQEVADLGHLGNRDNSADHGGAGNRQAAADRAPHIETDRSNPTELDERQVESSSNSDSENISLSRSRNRKRAKRPYKRAVLSSDFSCSDSDLEDLAERPNRKRIVTSPEGGLCEAETGRSPSDRTNLMAFRRSAKSNLFDKLKAKSLNREVETVENSSDSFTESE